MTKEVRAVLFPGRHHIVTRYQVDYLRALRAGLVRDDAGDVIECDPDVTIVWVVTSANHSGTRRNPLPGHRREGLIEAVAARESLRSVVVPVPDVAPNDRFAHQVVVSVETTMAKAGTGAISPQPANTIVACSTPEVADLYRALGYRIAGVELDAGRDVERPWDVIERIGAGRDGWRAVAHPAAAEFYDRYGLDRQITQIFADPVVSGDGDLTATRDYRTYAAAFEDASQRKWAQLAPWVRPGRIVDIGCATGGLLACAAREPRLHESDLFGVDVARPLIAAAEHRREAGDFANPHVWFIQANILTETVMPPESVDTTTTVALTHEIASYGRGVADVAAFARRVFAHTRPGGVWLNSDVCAPADPDRVVLLAFRTAPSSSGASDAAGPMTARTDLDGLDRDAVTRCIGELSDEERLIQFAYDFPRLSGASFDAEPLGRGRWRMSLRDAMEFLTTKDYVDNWLSECHERFCDLTAADWRSLLQEAGFELAPGGGPWRNDWLVANRFAPSAELLDAATGDMLEWPDTHILTIARRPPLT